MANVLLGVTGSVAAIRTPELYRQLRLAGHAVKVVATQAALYFFDPTALDPGVRASGTRTNGPAATRAGSGSATIRCCTSSCAAGPTCW